jgi:hypothetical protein
MVFTKDYFRVISLSLRRSQKKCFFLFVFCREIEPFSSSFFEKQAKTELQQLGNKNERKEGSKKNFIWSLLCIRQPQKDMDIPTNMQQRMMQ